MPRPRTAARRLPALPAAVAALLLAGCTADSPDGDAGAAPAVPLDQLLTTAAASTAESGTSRLSLTTQTSTGGTEVLFVGEGAYDHAADEGRLVFRVPTEGGEPVDGGTIEERLVGDDLYLSLPEPAGVFYRLTVADVASTSLGGSAEPTAWLQALQGLTDVEEVGHAEVRGVETTRYRGELDVEDAVAGASGTAAQVLEASLRATDAERIPFEADLDGEGRLVRLVHQIDVPAGPATGGREVTSRGTLELYDFGTEVDVAVPPPASVRDGAALLAALRSATGPESSPAPSPAPSSTG